MRDSKFGGSAQAEDTFGFEELHTSVDAGLRSRVPLRAVPYSRFSNHPGRPAGAQMGTASEKAPGTFQSEGPRMRELVIKIAIFGLLGNAVAKQGFERAAPENQLSISQTIWQVRRA
jgi:hypothetical protein